MSDTSKYLILFTIVAFGVASCSIRRPCQEGGDTYWYGKVFGGDKKCHQKKSKDGKYVNHGNYKEYFKGTKKIGLEGQYADGEKNGIWREYNEEGKKIKEVYFEKGVEKPFPTKPEKSLDRRRDRDENDRGRKKSR